MKKIDTIALFISIVLIISSSLVFSKVMPKTRIEVYTLSNSTYIQGDTLNLDWRIESEIPLVLTIALKEETITEPINKGQTIIHSVDLTGDYTQLPEYDCYLTLSSLEGEVLYSKDIKIRTI